MMFKARHSSASWNPKTRFQEKSGLPSRENDPAKPRSQRKLDQSSQPDLWIPACAGMTELDTGKPHPLSVIPVTTTGMTGCEFLLYTQHPRTRTTKLPAQESRR